MRPSPAVRKPADDRDPVVVGVFRVEDADGLRVFASERHPTGTPWLAVLLASTMALVGPMGIAGRAGCGECARRRAVAATAARGHGGDTAESAALARDTVLDRVRSLLCDPAARVRLREHVLRVAADGTESWHRVVPLPWCPVCGGAAVVAGAPEPLGAPTAEDPPEAVVERLAGWLDPVVGVVAGFAVDHDGADGLPIVVTALPPHLVDDDGTVRALPVGWGKGCTMSAALLSAVGEAVERYAASLPDPRRVRWARPDELDGDVLDPRSLPLYADEQYERPGFPFVRFDPGVRHPWVRGWWLLDRAPVWVPAVPVYLAFDLQPEHLFCQGSSSGLAAATNLDDAARRATMELVERDAFLLAWRTATAGRRIDAEALSPELRGVVAALERHGPTVETYVLPTAARGTVALCLCLGDGVEWPGAALGMGADLDAHAAVRQAVLELGQTGPHLRRAMRSGWMTVPSRPEDVREMIDHAAYWFPAERVGVFDRIRSDDQPVTDLASVAGARTSFAASRLRVALVDVTSPDVASGPFRVVRAISPDLQPLTYGYGLDRLLVDRVQGGADQAAPVHPVW